MRRDSMVLMRLIRLETISGLRMLWEDQIRLISASMPR